MAETEPVGEVEPATTTNGSGQLEDKVQEVIPEKKDEEESSAKVLENVEASSDKKKPQDMTKAVAEDAKVAEHESSQTAEAVESKITEAQNAEMIEPEDAKVSVANSEDSRIIEAEGAPMVAQTVEVEANVARKTAETEAVKMTEPVVSNATKAAFDDPKTIEADDENAKTIETDNTNMTTQIVDGKASKAEAEIAKATGFEAEDVKMPELLNAKTTESADAKPTEVEAMDPPPAEAETVDAKPVEAETAEAVNSDTTVSNVDNVKKPQAKEEKTFKAARTVTMEAKDAKMNEAKDTKIMTAEYVKTAETKDQKAAEAEEVKAKEADDVKPSEAGDAEVMKTKDAKTVEGENGKTAEEMDVKILASKELKASKPKDIMEFKDENVGDVKMAEAEDLNDAKGDKEKVEEEEAEIQNEDSATGKTDDSPDKKTDDNMKAKGLKRKRSSKPKVSGESEEKKAGSKMKAEEGFSTPVSSFVDRPVRERKTVERLVEVIEKDASREFLIEKGRGTALKDIPNVAHKLSRKKPADLKFLHQTLFGRKGKAVDFKSHLLRFSGFVWHENEEKQRAKIKEKLDKCVKDALLELCDLFDIHAAKASSRKEDLVVKLLDFMAAPYATTDVVLAEKYQLSPRSGKRKRVSQGTTSSTAEITPAKWVRKKRTKSENTPKLRGKFVPEINEEDEEDEGRDSENGLPNENKAQHQSESEGKKGDSEEASEDEDDEDWGKDKTNLKKIPTSGSEKSKLQASHKKAPVSPGKMSPSKRTKLDDTNNLSAMVFSRKKRNIDTAKKPNPSKSATKEKSSGKKVSKAEEEKEFPSNEELRETICGVLKEVDFSMATFTDIVKRLAAHYNMDLSGRKNTIKTMVQEELTKLANEAEEDEDGDGRDAEGEHPKPKAKEIEA